MVQYYAGTAVSGRGEIASFTVVRRGISRAYEAPYVVAPDAGDDTPPLPPGALGEDLEGFGELARIDLLARRIGNLHDVILVLGAIGGAGRLHSKQQDRRRTGRIDESVHLRRIWARVGTI